jgi:hypothetical protein
MDCAPKKRQRSDAEQRLRKGKICATGPPNGLRAAPAQRIFHGQGRAVSPRRKRKAAAEDAVVSAGAQTWKARLPSSPKSQQNQYADSHRRVRNNFPLQSQIHRLSVPAAEYNTAMPNSMDKEATAPKSSSDDPRGSFPGCGQRTGHRRW